MYSSCWIQIKQFVVLILYKTAHHQTVFQSKKNIIVIHSQVGCAPSFQCARERCFIPPHVCIARKTRCKPYSPRKIGGGTSMRLVLIIIFPVPTPIIFQHHDDQPHMGFGAIRFMQTPNIMTCLYPSYCT